MSNRYGGPVVIGGVGGSGTRVIATFLRRLGFYLGSDLNLANDNLWFTLLLARSKWFARSSKKDVIKALRIFEKAMMGHLSPTHNELWFVLQAVVDLSFHEYLHWEPSQVKQTLKSMWPMRVGLKVGWSLKRVTTMYLSNGIGSTNNWGWKEPCSYIYLDYLSEFFEDLKYIHIVRHGLDMAYSQNQGHLYSWGHFFDVKAVDWPELSPNASLDYWIESNQATISQGEKLLGNRFLMVNFDELCHEPRKEIMRVIKFLDLNVGNVDINGLCDLCKVPKSLGRHKKHDLSVFDEEKIYAVRRLGFVVDTTNSTNVR